MNQEQNIKKEKKQNKRRIIYYLMTATLLVMIASIIFMRYKMASIANETEQISKRYDKHYVMITENSETEFWKSVYDAAAREGEENQIFVEQFGANLNNVYDKNQLMRIAIDASVDGIILEGDETAELKELINEAAEKKIPVVTVRDDCSADGRISFVGISSYNLGKAYGAKLISLINADTRRVYVLMDANTVDLGQEIVVSGIQDAVNIGGVSNEDFVIEGMLIDSSGAFGSEEAIRDIFLDEKNFPDVIICLSSVFTKCAFQAAVDYNKVGELSILGYYDSDDILEAVSKNILHSTISIDTESMGKMSVQALLEYQTTGYVSNYMAVDTKMIGQYYAQSMLEERRQEVQ